MLLNKVLWIPKMKRRMKLYTLTNETMKRDISESTPPH